MMTETFDAMQYGDRWIIVNNVGARYGTATFDTRDDADYAIAEYGLAYSDDREWTDDEHIGDDAALLAWAKDALPSLHDDVPNPTIADILDAIRHGGMCALYRTPSGGWWCRDQA